MISQRFGKRSYVGLSKKINIVVCVCYYIFFVDLLLIFELKK